MLKAQRLRSQFIWACCLLLIVVAVAEADHAVAAECGRDFTRNQVVSLLRAGGFTGWLRGDPWEPGHMLDELTIDKIGDVKAGKRCLHLYMYIIRHHLRGCAHHETDRLLVLTDTQYLGSYIITEFPLRLRGNVLEFPRDKRFPNENLGYRIVFGPDGPPGEIYLLGETHSFFK